MIRIPSMDKDLALIVALQYLLNGCRPKGRWIRRTIQILLFLSPCLNVRQLFDWRTAHDRSH